MESQVSALLKERNDVPDENEGSESNQEATTPSPEQPPSPPPSPMPTHYTAGQNLSQPSDQLPVQYSAQQQLSDQTANMDLNIANAAEKINAVHSSVENIAVDSSQHTSN